ncbi:MAG: copper-translocating P-type ATPase [Bacteroidales bacterium]|nr:copper-translocating P-type ATPase [Bacteroidales bacterium]
MSCASCALNVERMLKKQPGIRNASVNYANASAQVEMMPGDINLDNLQQAIRAIGYDILINDKDEGKGEAEQQSRYSKLKTNMAGSLILAIPVMILSMFYMDHHAAHGGISPVNLLLAGLTLPVLAWFGRNFFISAFKLARHRQANMDTLVALSTGIAFIFSLFNTFFPQFWLSRGIQPHVYYEASAVIIAFILIGKVLEEGAKVKTSSAIKKLMGLQPDMATLIDDSGREVQMPIARIMINDQVRVKPGEKMPVDGIVASGALTLDESSITGESMPAEKQAGDTVFAGTLCVNGSAMIRAGRVGSETVLAGIITMVQKAQGTKAPVQKTVDRIAGIFVPVVLGISILSFIIWMLAGGDDATSRALMAMVTVLVIACPCALGLATPTAIMVGIGKGARNGILIRDAESIELIQKVKAVVMDKTGTLTQGSPAVTDIIWLDESTRPETEPVLLEMEKRSAHPLAQAIVTALEKNKHEPLALDDFENITGRGIKAAFAKKQYFSGNSSFMADEGIPIGAGYEEKIKALQASARTVVFFAEESTLLAVIGLADTLKPTSSEAVHQLKSAGIAVYMLTGDNHPTAASIAQQAGIEHYQANMLPSDKADFIKNLQANGVAVAMVGDGINDSQAMVQADAGIAMGKGSDIAMDVAGMTIISSDLRQIPKAIRLSKLTVRTIRQNLFWAFIYNIIGIPIAAGILYPLWGFMLNPMIAAAAMALSSVSVVSNSLRLRGARL